MPRDVESVNIGEVRRPKPVYVKKTLPQHTPEPALPLDGGEDYTSPPEDEKPKPRRRRRKKAE